MEKKISDPFYHTDAWKEIRKQALQRDGGMCRDCMDRMLAGYGIRPNRADMVHHVIPRKERPDLELNLDNLRSLCNTCHNKKHPDRRQAKGHKERENKHTMRVIKV